jgi:hypothetical protein
MVAPTITDPFFRKLYNALAGELDDRVNGLARGSALILGQNTGLDAITTAMKYQAAVAYIEALQAVIDLGIQLDHDHYGNRTKPEDE